MSFSKPHKPGRFFALALFFIGAIILLDQYTKWLVTETMLKTGGKQPLFGDWFLTRQPLPEFMDQQETYNHVTINPYLDFVMVWNKGVSFGLFDSGNPTMALVLIAFSLLISMGLFIWMSFANTRLLSAALPFIIGGAVANAIDRFRFGAVADFIDVHINDSHWPAFNLADSCICLGAALLVIDTLMSAGKGKKV
ncbi:MAG: signal peptidase II [Micavibrio sp.]|nr:signal peptidase II [Micavibrio sp.]